MTNKEIATIIWQQMNEIDRNLVWCMGVKAPTVIENGLQFKVSGLSFKGIVQIKLNGNDLYDVTLVKPVKTLNKVAAQLGVKTYNTEFKVIESFNNIFVEDLMPLLETEIENKTK